MTSFLCALPFLSSLALSCAPPPPFATGYVEGDYLLIAPVAISRVDHVAVRRGDRAESGQALVSMEQRDAEIALAQAEAALAEAEARLADLHAGTRPEDIRRIEAVLSSARARHDEAARTEARMRALFARQAVTQTQRDDAATAAEVARALVAQTEADLAVARLPARKDVLEAAVAAVDAARARRDTAKWALEQRQLSAPANGTVFDLLRGPGEIAGPSAPVISFLPDEAVVLRLYVAQGDLAVLHPGDPLAVECDGCPPDLSATVSWISDAPEFTPPVIYSEQNRQTLVYQIEARPDAGADALRPGQIVDVRLPAQIPE